MILNNPLFLVLFFGIFHVFGGLALGKGVRDRLAKDNKGNSLIAWGVLMGVAPALFDWVFLVNQGYVWHGLTGPVLFITAAAIAAIFFTEKLTRVHEKSIGAILMGGAALLLGLALAPYLVKQALTMDLSPADYIFGSCLLVLPLFVGFGFVWNGVTAILKNRAFDEHIAEREKEIEEKASRKKKAG